MVTRIKFLLDTQISYGPQNVVRGQVLDCENDSVANALIGQGLAVLDSTDAVTVEPLIDGGINLPGDPGGELEQDTTTG